MARMLAILKYFLAMAMIKTNEETQAVKILHSCVSQDPEGIVARRMLGANMNFSLTMAKNQFIDWIPNPIEAFPLL